MKSAKLLNLLVAGLLLATFASGCQKGPKNITAIPANQRGIRGEGMNTQIQGTGVQRDGGLVARDPGGELTAPLTGPRDDTALAAHTIYFEFDKIGIQPSEQTKLDAVATYLKNTPGVQVLVEGHCDERGTEEYNRSLGERRALAAREYLLQKHGISSERVTTTSMGENQPASLEKTEEAYQKNRRAAFIVLRPQ
jgi:peptidoglycan-associated lipoprotein